MKFLLFFLFLSACSFFTSEVKVMQNEKTRPNTSSISEPKKIPIIYNDLVPSIAFSKSIIKHDLLFVCDKVDNVYRLYCNDQKSPFSGDISIIKGNLKYLWSLKDGKIVSLKFFENNNLIFDYSNISFADVSSISGVEQKSFYKDGKIKTLIKMVGFDFEVYNYCPQGQIFKNDSVRFSQDTFSYDGIYIVNFLTDVFKDGNLVSKVANKFVKNGRDVSFYIGDIPLSSLNGDFKIVPCDAKLPIEQFSLHNGRL